MPVTSKLLGALLALCLAGCATGTGPTNVGRGGIEGLHLFGVPTALNLDQTPEVDGFAARIYATGPRTAKGVAITEGTLELLMFDGALHGTNAAAAKPLRIWTFSPAELKSYSATSSLGLGYRFVLPWGEAKPKRDHLTLLARHVRKGGTAVYSGSSTIAVGVK